MSKIQIRQANLTDYIAIKNLMLIALQSDPMAFSVDYKEYEHNSDDWWNSYITPYVLSSRDKMFLAIDNNVPVGMIGILYDYKQRRQHVATIVWFYTLKEFRGKGIGKRLLQKAIDDAKYLKMEKITLLVNSPQQKAIRMYEDLAFKINGRLVNEYKIDDNYIDCLIMELMLN